VHFNTSAPVEPVVITAINESGISFQLVSVRLIENPQGDRAEKMPIEASAAEVAIRGGSRGLSHADVRLAVLRFE
jgi:hypothetical protein